MKKLFIVSAYLIFSMSQLFSQNLSDSIEIRRSAGVKYFQNGYPLTQKQVLSIMKTDNVAYNEMQIAKEKSISAIVFGAAGGFLVGYQVGKMLTGAITNKLWIGVGGALMIISIPISAQSYKHAKNAVNFYNSGLNQSGFHKVKYRIGLNENGIGLSLHF